MIEFKVLLIIKRFADTSHSLFLPVRAEMTKDDIAKARHCFEVETPDMVRDITRGKVKFTPTVVVSEKPLHSFDPRRLDSAEYMGDELLAELSSLAVPGDYDSVGYYFLYFDNASGYRIPRAGYGVGGYDRRSGIGMFGIGSPSDMNPRDEVFLHEWMHGLDGYYGDKEGVRLPKGALHGGRNYDAHYNVTKPWRPRDSFRGYMEWYADIFNARVPEADGFSGYGDAAWKHGPMRVREGLARSFPSTPPSRGSYPDWVYQMMNGVLKNAELGPTLIPAGMRPGNILSRGTPWRLENWSRTTKLTARYAESDGGCFTLDAPLPADASIGSDIPVDPSANYLFTVDVKTDDVRPESSDKRCSVRISAASSYTTRDFSGSNRWTQVVLPFTTKPDQNSVTLRMQLGGQGCRASGRVVFRHPMLRKIGFPARSVK